MSKAQSIIWHYWRPKRCMVVKYDGKVEFVNHVDFYGQCHTMYPKTPSMPHIVLQCRGQVVFVTDNVGHRTAYIEAVDDEYYFSDQITTQ